MRYFKFISEEHSLNNNASTIRIGTFSYYRNMDPDFAITDKNEGIGKYSGTHTLTEKNLHHLPGLEQFIQVEEGSKANVTFSDTSFSSPIPNTYMFCCTEVQDNVSDKALRKIADSLEKESWYEIRNPQEFSELCARRIFESLKLSNFPEALTKNLKLMDLGRFEIFNQHKPVSYVKNIAIPMGNEMLLPHQVYAERLFTKEEKYASDSEYRFIFILQHPTIGIISIPTEYIDINTSPFNDGCIN